MSEEITQELQNLTTDECNDESHQKRHNITLYVKAGSDHESIGCCPFSQRLFMLLWLKGVVFHVTTVDMITKSKELKDIAPGTKPPFIVFNEEVVTDIGKCEDMIDAELCPPYYPKMAVKYPKSNTIGNDIFHKFSAFIKFRGDRRSDEFKKLEAKLIESLAKFNAYLEELLDHEIDADCDDDKPHKSCRKFIDGDHMTIADCNMLSKLNIIRVCGKHMLNFEIPAAFEGIHRYLDAADHTPEFSQTCPDDEEILVTYGGRMKPRR